MQRKVRRAGERERGQRRAWAHAQSAQSVAATSRPPQEPPQQAATVSGFHR